MAPLFGPENFTRVSGPAQSFTQTFQGCGIGPARIVTKGYLRSGVEILLNGVLIVGPRDLSQQVSEIVKPVVLADNNELTVKLATKPGSTTMVMVEVAVTNVVTAGVPGVSAADPTSLSTAIPLVNNGPSPLGNVKIISIRLANSFLTSPTLPLDLGTISPNGAVVLNASFVGGPFLPGSIHNVTINGDFTIGGVTGRDCFVLGVKLKIPPAAPGSADIETVDIEPQRVTDAPFPHLNPTFGPRTNPGGWTVPVGPFVPGTPAGQTGTQSIPTKSDRTQGNPVIFTDNDALAIGANSSTTAEPSGASGGGVIFATGNWWAAFSTDGGATFTELDPTTIFPNDAVGFCCDQIVQYIPSIDRFIWFLQGNGYRLAAASPAAIINSNGTAWTYWNLTPNIFGQPNGTGFDYPDLSLGNGFLYMCWDAGAGCPAGCTQGFQVARTSFTGIQASGTITIGFTNPANGTMCWGSHIMQDTGDEVFWAGHNNNSQMRIFSLAENSNTYFWRDRSVSSWPTNAPTSLTPDGRDWLAKNFNGPAGNSFPYNGVIGATRVFNQLWFAWTAGTNSSFGQAHVQIVTFDRSNNFSKTQQVQIWNNDYAFGYPALSTNACTNEVGLSLEYGGGGNYENHVVGFWGDFIVYVTSGSTVGTNRFGDYVTIRRRPPTEQNRGNLFDAFGYGLNPNSDIRYVGFGRPASSCVVIPKAADEPPIVPAEVKGTEPGGIAIHSDPGTPGMEVSFTHEVDGPVRLRVYDIRGRLVRDLEETRQAGRNTLRWDGMDAAGRLAASGIYLFQVKTGSATHSAKAVWTR